MQTDRADIRNSLICAAIALAALLAAWPFANLPFDDDWTWAFTVKQLQLTGHLVYNGWSSPSVVAQAYWGLLWVKAFGFSFNVLRVSSIPMSIGAVALCCLLARQAQLTAPRSIFVALLLGLSPIYMPLEATFMTDAPGLFFMLLSLCAIVRGFDSKWTGGSVGWLMFGAMAALVGGSSRQVVWIVPLVVLPYFAWVQRGKLAFVTAAAIGWVIVLVGAYGTQHWFAQQPFALPDPALNSYISLAVHHPKQFVIDMIFTLLTLTLILLPVVFGVVFRPSPLPRMIVVVTLALIIGVGLAFCLRRMHPPIEPWMGNVFTSTGPLGSIEIAGGRPAFQSDRFKHDVSLVVVASMSLLMASALVWVVQNTHQVPEFFLRSKTAHPLVPAMVLLVLALFGLEMTRWVSNVAYDRHLLPFIPFIAIPLLHLNQQQGVQRMSTLSWSLLALYAMVAIAATQEVNSLARARVAAIQKLNEKGIANYQIDAGFEHDYWTQLQVNGHINDARIANPPGAYDKKKGPTPGMQIVYRLESKPTGVTQTTPFGTVEYFSLLPPFYNMIYIDKFTDPWWLDPGRAATRPVEKSLLPQVLLDQYKRK